MEKKKYEFIKDVKRRLAAGEKTEFWERNILNIEETKKRKKERDKKKAEKAPRKRIQTTEVWG